MEHQKILNLLIEASDSTFVKRKSNIVCIHSNTNFAVGNEIIYNAEISKYSLWDYNNSYTLVRGNIIVVGINESQMTLKICASFIKCITKINKTKIDDAEDLDLIMLMYCLIECSSNYSDLTGSLWFFSKDEGTNFNVYIAFIDAFKALKH